MQITGGSFGTGRAWVRNQYINLRGAIDAHYPLDSIQHADMQQEPRRHIGIVGMIAGILFLGWLGFVIAGPIGLLAGIVISIAGSFYTKTTYSATLRFDDGKSVVLTGPRRSLRQLIAHAGR